MLKVDGFDAAIIGVTETWLPEPRLVYDGQKILALLMAQGMSDLEALEYCNFNIEGAYMGEDTPLIVWPFEEEDYADSSIEA
jgi:hypothetical protein